jgi:hypothetical protein
MGKYKIFFHQIIKITRNDQIQKPKTPQRQTTCSNYIIFFLKPVKATNRRGLVLATNPKLKIRTLHIK